MEMTPESTPGSSSAKRTRAKPKVTTKAKAAAKPVEAPVAKKPRAPRKTLTTKSTVAEVAVSEPSAEALGGMIATAAYYLAAARNFTPGHELDDWLEAERSVRAKLYG
ncbi:MAG: DUF2934 domain-containing protein [Steroidobacter sp.]